MSDYIDRQAAVNSVAKGLKGTFVEYQDVAEKLLENVPSVQPEKMQLSEEDATFPVEGTTLDCISRQQAILCIERNAYRREDINETERIILWVLDIIKWLPSVQLQRMRGRWETIEGWDGDIVYRCSECGEEFVLIDGTPKEYGYHFCHNCGADMRGTE